MAETENLASLFLRIGLAFAFFYVAISSFINPQNWIGFMPSFIQNITGAYTLAAFSVYEIVLGLWLLSNKKIFYVAILSALTMVGIIIFNLSAIDIVFRDVSIFFMAIALALISRNKN